MNYNKVVFALFTGMVAWAGASNAAVVTASVDQDPIGINDTAVVELFLELGSGELASVFDGVFDLTGLDTVATASLTAGGSTWDSSFGSIMGSRVTVSLTSDNLGGDRLVATLEVVGLAPGTFEVLFNDETSASFDIDDPPFVEEVNITNADGDPLASVTVVPVPAALPLLGSALVGLAFGLKRGRQRGLIRRAA